MSAQLATGSACREEAGDSVDGGGGAVGPGDLSRIYRAQFDFIWRSARRLGVDDAHVDDVVQEVFLVAHRRLADFEGRSSVKTWLFGILRHLVQNHRRRVGKKRLHERLEEGEVAAEASPVDDAERAQAARVLDELLDQLDDSKREVFVLTHLEEMSAPEIAEALDVNLNTVYSRLRLARRDLERALERRRARDPWREP